MRPRFAILSVAVLIGIPPSLSASPGADAGDARIYRQAGEFERPNDRASVTAKPTFGVPGTGDVLVASRTSDHDASQRPAAGTRPAHAAPARMAQGRSPASPSFSCRGRLNRTELRICENPTLAGLDRKIASIYSWLRGRLSPSERRGLRNDQRQWLRQRDRCGADDTCIERELYDRMAYLNEYQ